MCTSLWDFYVQCLEKENAPEIMYYGQELKHDSFKDLDYEDIERYFKYAGKLDCLHCELNKFFAYTDEGKRRVSHMFSVYLLGIWCYDNIANIRKAFDSFIEKIWAKTHEHDSDKTQKRQDVHEHGSDETQKRKDFLYLWYLTALFHDMGYLYESRGDDDNSEYTDIIEHKNMLGKDYLNAPFPMLGTPEKLWKSARKYFYKRRKNKDFMENGLTCVYHGFAGGFTLFEKLRELHNKYKHEPHENPLFPTSDKQLVFDPLIFQWYNVPSAWAIICHNIWLAVAGSVTADKYEQFGLEDLVFPANKSPIKLKSHPLLFLLDFVDTLDPLKRFCFDKNGKPVDYDFLKQIYIKSSSNSMTLKMDCEWNEDGNKKQLEKIASAFTFLKSDSFSIEQNANSLTFYFSLEK